MSQERVAFPAGDAVLEGELLDGGGGTPFVVSHPHPLHGGDMEHPVVVALWRAAAARGLRALRYNFRGVGGSTGALTPKSSLALHDLAGAIAFLGGGPLLAAGYSYGARVTLHALHEGNAITRAVLVALPTRLPANPSAMSNLILGRPIASERFRATPDLDLLSDLRSDLRSAALVIAGDRDPLVEPAELAARGVEPWLMPGLNHFFSRRLGNQAQEAGDLEAMAERAMGFLLDASP